MTYKPPQDDAEFAELVERTLEDVPLDAGELDATARATGIDPYRLVARIQDRVRAVQHEARVAAFAEADRARSAAASKMLRGLERPRRRTEAEARAQLFDLRGRGGVAVEMHFHKLDEYSLDDLNHILDEIEALLAEGDG